MAFSILILFAWLFLVGYRFLVRFQVTDTSIDVTLLGAVLQRTRIANIRRIKLAPAINVMKELSFFQRFSTFTVTQGFFPSTAIVIESGEYPFKHILTTSDAVVIDRLTELAHSIANKGH